MKRISVLFIIRILKQKHKFAKMLQILLWKLCVQKSIVKFLVMNTCKQQNMQIW